MTATAESITEKIQSNLFQMGFLSNRTLVVAVSGGSDSVVLLDSLHSMSGTGLKLYGAHVNHGLIGESKATSKYVEQLFASFKIPFTIFQTQVVKEKGRSEEESARRVRYQFLAEVAAVNGADAVLTAHTADDQLETILMNIVRGSSISGLCGMKPYFFGRLFKGMDEICLIRPMLGVSKQETKAFCEQRGLDFVLDPANNLLRYRRNRFRHLIIPELLRLNPNIVGNISFFTKEAQEFEDFMGDYSEQAYQQLKSADNDFSLDQHQFTDLHLALQPRVIKKLLQKMLGSTAGFDRGDYTRVMDLAIKDSGTITLKGGVYCRVRKGKIEFTMSSELGTLLG